MQSNVLTKNGKLQSKNFKRYAQFNVILHVIRMSFVCHLYVLLCHSYVIHTLLTFACMSSIYRQYVIRTSFVCARMSLVCHSYVPVCHISLVCTPMSSVCHSYVIRILMSLVCGFTMNLKKTSYVRSTQLVFPRRYANYFLSHVGPLS